MNIGFLIMIRMMLGNSGGIEATVLQNYNPYVTLFVHIL